jgi:YD repeat-containing protein
VLELDKDEAYTYDAAGNRLSALVGGSTTNYAYNANGQLCKVSLRRDSASTGPLKADRFRHSRRSCSKDKRSCAAAI